MEPTADIIDTTCDQHAQEATKIRSRIGSGSLVDHQHDAGPGNCYVDLKHDDLAGHLEHHLFSTSSAWPEGNEVDRTAQAIPKTIQHSHDHLAPLQDRGQQGSGVESSVASSLIQCALEIASPGDMVLIGRPFPNRYTSDLWHGAGVVAVSTSFGAIDPLSVETVPRYEQAYRAAQAGAPAGHKVRALLICSPHDPLGRCYPRQTLKDLIRFCQRERLHLIADETSAIGVIDRPDLPEREKFTSILSIEKNDLIDASLVHVLWTPGSISDIQDESATCVTTFRNQSLICAFNASASLKCSREVMRHLGHWYQEHEGPIEDLKSRFQSFLAENYVLVTEILTNYGIPFSAAANVSLFIWVNLGAALKLRNTSHPHTQKLENIDGSKHQELAEVGAQFHWTEAETMAFLQNLEVLVAPGSEFNTESEGWVRIALSHDREVILEGLSRIVMGLGLQAVNGSELLRHRNRKAPRSDCMCGLCEVLGS